MMLQQVHSTQADASIHVCHLQQHTVVWQYFIRGSGSWQGLWLRSAPCDSQTMAGRPEHCVSRPGEREPEPPNRAANLTNGLVRLRSHQPQLLQESPEKWHRRGDLQQVWGDLLNDENFQWEGEGRGKGEAQTPYQCVAPHAANKNELSQSQS